VPAEAGIKFGSYVLLRRIARGGMAEVFLAQQRGLEGFDRRVAVKRILPHLADSPDFVKMFLAEAKLAAQLGHPNIVHIYDFGKVEHDYFIAMEFVDGVHAGQVWKYGEQAERMSPTLVARIGADAATALHYAHELRNASGKPLGLVHRDVSPANIMVSYDGVVKLCDFGIAKAAAVQDQLTNPGQVKGKYAYMSPEQTVAQPLDGRSDVFSLAICLWELLSGKFIVPRGDAVAAMRMIRDGKLEPLAIAAPAVPRPLQKAITWALEPRRDKRATAMDLAQALESFIKGSPELATSMQLGAWIRQRFEREQTGQVLAIAPSGGHGTQVATPGTMASPPTSASQGNEAAITPQPVQEDGTEIRETQAFDAEGTSTNKIKPYTVPAGRSTPSAPTARPFAAAKLPKPYPPGETPTPIVVQQPFASDAFTLKESPDHVAQPFSSGALTIAVPQDATVLDDPITPRSRAAAEEPTVLAGNRTVVDADQETSDARETVEMSAARVPPMSSGPAIVPTMSVVPLSAPHARIPGSGPNVPPRSSSPVMGGAPPRPLVQFLTPWRRYPGVDRRRARRLRIAAAISGLFALALISFAIALAASGSHKAVAIAEDAGVDVAARLAVAPDASPIDAASVAPTFPADASLEAYLEVSTIPDGGKVVVGDQVRTAPAQIVLARSGTFEVTADLAGYQTETREVTIEAGEHEKLEIAFTHKLGGHVVTPAATGKLSVRTMPYAEMYENGKKVADTPFADREVSAGVHTFVFKNPQHPSVTKKITIVAGKLTRLSFNLPD
jgi:serine/threonine-protein kinase